jgi:hypothetical protein
LADTVEHIVRVTMYGPTRRTPLARSRSAASTWLAQEPPPEPAIRPMRSLDDRRRVEAGVGDRVFHGDVREGGGVALEAALLAVDARVEVDDGRPPTWSGSPAPCTRA